MSEDMRRLEVPVECTGLCAACQEYGLSSDEVADIARPVVAAELDRIADAVYDDRDTCSMEFAGLLRSRAAVLRG